MGSIDSITPEQLYIRFGGLLFGSIAFFIWILSSISADVIPNFIKITFSPIVGFLAFLIFVFVYGTLIYDFTVRLLLHYIISTSTGFYNWIKVWYSHRHPVIKFFFISCGIIIPITVLCWIFVAPPDFSTVMITVIGGYFVIVAADIAKKAIDPFIDKMIQK